MGSLHRLFSLALVVASACKTSPPVAATMTIPSTAPTTTNAAADPGSDAGSSSASAGRDASSPCEGRCKGRPGEKLVEWLSYLAKKSHRCYDQALAIDAKLKGRVRITVRIGADGEICEARGDGDGAMQSVADCAADTFRLNREALPAPEGGCAEVVVPINFLPRPADAGAMSSP
jgi:hypothetical protein